MPASPSTCMWLPTAWRPWPFCRHEGAHAVAPRPDLILLDLNLPKMDGREVLARIKSDENLKTIPTVILTTSEAEADIAQSYQLQANCYLSKPVQLDEFETLVKSINDFWLTKGQIAAADAKPMRRKNAGRLVSDGLGNVSFKLQSADVPMCALL